MEGKLVAAITPRPIYNLLLRRKSGTVLQNKLTGRPISKFCFSQHENGPVVRELCVQSLVWQWLNVNVKRWGHRWGHCLNNHQADTHTPVWPHLCVSTLRFRLHKNSKEDSDWILLQTYRNTSYLSVFKLGNINQVIIQTSAVSR